MSDSKVVSFSKHQQEKQEGLRREYERVLYKQLLGFIRIAKVDDRSIQSREVVLHALPFSRQLRFPSASKMERLERTLARNNPAWFLGVSDIRP